MKQQRIWAARAARFVLFMAILGLVLVSLNEAMMLRHRDGMSRKYYSFPKGTFDVVLLGSSLMMYDVLPADLYEQYGITSYNLATGNQSLGLSYYLAKEVIERDHPELIVLDCSRASVEEDTTKTSFIHYVTDVMPFFSRNRLAMISDLAEEGERNALRFPLIAYHSRWQDMEVVDENVYIKEGLYGARIMASSNEVVPFEKPVYVENAMTPAGRDYIERTIRLCKETDTDLLLVSLPIPGENEFLDQDEYNRRWSLTKEVGELADAEGVEYIGYIGREEELGIDRTADVFDGEHLNRWGAAKFTRLIGDHMQKKYGLADRRGTGGICDRIEKDLQEYPVYRMQACLRNASSLRRIAETLREDAHEKPVPEALVLLALNGTFDPENMGEKNAQRMMDIGLKQNLHEWTGHGWLAVIDGGKVVYESDPEKHGTADFTDETEGTAGELRYRVTSGVLDEETGEVGSGASIKVNRLEYTLPEKGLYCAVFNKETGKLLESCQIELESDYMRVEHLAP